MMTWHLVLLILYSALLIGLGLWTGRRVATSSGFFVAERRLSPVLLFATLLAANIGAGSTVGAAGLGYRDGVSAWFWVGSAGIGSILLGLWIGPRIWKTARQYDLQTVGDYLELRFGASVRGVVSSLLWVATLAILAGQFIGMAWILNVITGMPKWAGCLVSGSVMILYFTAGGLVSSAWVNLVQLVVLLAGFALALPLVLQSVGGWQGIAADLPAPALDPWAGGHAWDHLVLLVPAFIISPGLLQKIYGARDTRTVRLAVTGQGLVLLLFALVPMTLGMAARVLYPGLEPPAPGQAVDIALPHLLVHALPAWMGAISLAAILSAEISSADAVLFMLATSLSKDLYKRFLRPQADDRQVLRTARWAAISGGLLAVAMAIALSSVVDALSIFYSLLGLSLLVPILAGLYLRGGAARAALAAISAAVAVRLLADGLLDAPLAGWLTPQAMGYIASAAAFLLVLLIGSNRIRRRK